MDPLIQDFEFLDLTDINDVELEHLRNVLYATEPNSNAKYPELPWEEPVYDEALEMNGEPDNSMSDDAPPLNADVPSFPPSSTHLPVTMYQVMPSVYVNNVTANVSVHPYMSYHPVYPPQESQSTRGRRPKNNSKARDYRNNDPNLESPNTGGQMPQAYPASFIPMHHHPYSHFYTTPPPSAQHATGPPLYTMPIPSHVPMYTQPPIFPYHHPTMYSPIEHTPYSEVSVKENMPVSQYPPPEKLHTYDFNSQNRMKDNIPSVQYQNDSGNENSTHDSDYNNQNNEINTNEVSKDSIPIVQYQPDLEATNYSQQSDAVPSQNVINSEGPVGNLSVISDTLSAKKEIFSSVTCKSETPKAAIAYANGQYNDVEHDSVPSKLTPVFSKNIKVVENQNLKQDNKKGDIKPIPEVKMPGSVKFIGDVIVSELKSDAQVFQPASIKNTLVPQAPKDKSPVNNSARSPATSVKVETVWPSTPLPKEKPTEIVHQSSNATPVALKPNQAPVPSTTSPVAREDTNNAVTTVATEVNSMVQPVGKQSTSETTATVNSPAWEKSFASLFQKNSPADQDPSASRLVARVKPFQEARDPAATARTAAEARRTQLQCQDPHLYRLGELLCKYDLEHKSVSLLPRGLTNRSNWCYINSILQSLLACPPFYNLMKALPVPRKNQKSTTPILDSIVQFVNEFDPLSSVTRSRKERSFRKDDGSMDVPTGPSFEPAYIYTMLNNIRSDTFKVEGRQEDAEEFLSCLLNALNDEMMEVMKLIQDNETDQLPMPNGNDIANQDDSDSEWKVIMGSKNKGSITRRSDFGHTPISDIFRGNLRSRVHRAGGQFTDSVEPFFTLKLDIEKSQSVKEALELLVGRDQLEGVTCSKTNQEVEAWQQVTLEDLPVVLVLHLKWFDYDYKMDGCSKIMKTVDFPIELKVDSKLMSSTKKHTLKQKQYKLFAVVYHDGKEATKGHYVTDVFHVGYGGWIRYDDSTVRTVQEGLVLHPRIPRVPYLLYYRRCDTIGNQTPVR